jgi:hypothetical protein
MRHVHSLSLQRARYIGTFATRFLIVRSNFRAQNSIPGAKNEQCKESKVASRNPNGIAVSKNEFLTTGQVAKILHYHVSSIRRLSNIGMLRSFRIGSRRDRRYHRKDVLRLLAAQQNGG